MHLASSTTCVTPTPSHPPSRRRHALHTLIFEVLINVDVQIMIGKEGAFSGVTPENEEENLSSEGTPFPYKCMITITAGHKPGFKDRERLRVSSSRASTVSCAPSPTFFVMSTVGKSRVLRRQGGCCFTRSLQQQPE